MRDQTSSTLWFLSGLSIGAAIGLLYAPAAGAETRRKISQETGREFILKSRELMDRGRQFAEEAADMYDEGRRLFSETQRIIES